MPSRCIAPRLPWRLPTPARVPHRAPGVPIARRWVPLPTAQVPAWPLAGACALPSGTPRSRADASARRGGSAAPAAGTRTPLVGASARAVGTRTGGRGTPAPAVGTSARAVGTRTGGRGTPAPAVGTSARAVGTCTGGRGTPAPAVGTSARAVGTCTGGRGTSARRVGACAEHGMAPSPPIPATAKAAADEIPAGMYPARGSAPSAACIAHPRSNDRGCMHGHPHLAVRPAGTSTPIPA